MGEISRGGGSRGTRMSRHYQSNSRPQTAMGLSMPAPSINVVNSRKNFGTKALAKRSSVLSIAGGGGQTAINLRISKMDENKSEQAYTDLQPKRKKGGKRPQTA